MSLARYRLASGSLCVLALVGSACRMRGDAPSTEVVEQRQGALDFQTGDVKGTVSWGGVALTSGEASDLYMFEAGSVGHYVDHADYELLNVTAGPHTVEIYGNGCTGPSGTKLGQQSFVVTAGATVDADFELAGSAGRVVGSVRVNGTPLANSLVQIVGGGVCTQNTMTDANGMFSRILPPGDFSAHIFSPAGLLRSVSFTIAVGKQEDLADLDVQVGDVTGTVSWGGVPLTAGEASDLYMFESGSVGHYVDHADYELLNVSAGPHTVEIYGNGCTGPSGTKLGQQSFVVTAGATVDADFELAGSAGRVVGSVRVNGAPLANSLVQIVGGGVCTQNTMTDANGMFSRILPPGDFSAYLFSPAGLLRSVSFTIAVGKQEELADLDVQVGDVTGTLSWGGVPLTAGEASDLYMFEPGSVGHYADHADYELLNVSAGPHTVEIYGNGCTGPSGTKLGQQSFVVTAGATVDADFELAGSAGRVVGSVRVNGAPLANSLVQIVGGGVCTQNTMTDANGMFSRILPPGDFTAYLFSSAGLLSSVRFPMTAGRTTSVDSVTTPKCSDTTIPKCSEIPTKLDGGLAKVNGLELTFSEVTVGGNTTVVKSNSCVPACNPPPDGFTVVGSQYWDLHTAADHTGPITVCIHYDPTNLMGDEDDLDLMHDDNDGAGWKVITSSLCKSDGCIAKSETCEECTTPAIICGVATSFSPFAIMEPLRAPDTKPPAFSGVPGTVTAYATSTAGAVVGYVEPTAVDDVDGPTSVSCTRPSGSQFPPGQTTVTCHTADTSGNPNSVSFVVWVQYQASADGSFFIRPIRADGSSVFKIGRPVPVKFRLTGASQNITNLQAHLVVTKISDQIRGTADDESDEDGDETDFLFKYRKAKGIYAYRWKTGDQTRGTYRLRAELGDGVVHEINVSLKARR